MPPSRVRAFHVLIQNLAASVPASWLLSRILRYTDRLTLALTGGRKTLTGMLAGLPVIQVTTTGAHSGKLRTSLLVAIDDPASPGRLALVATNFGQHHFPSWYFNLKKDPRAVCTLDGQATACLAHEAAGDEYDRFSQLANGVYRGYASYRQRAGRRIPIMVLERETRP